MELTRGERQIDDVGDGRSKDRSTCFQKPGKNLITVRLLVSTVDKSGPYRGVGVGFRWFDRTPLPFSRQHDMYRVTVVVLAVNFLAFHSTKISHFK